MYGAQVDRHVEDLNRPYGLAWLLQLSAELREWPDPQAQLWSRSLQPLEAEAAARIKVRFVSGDPRSSSPSQLWLPSTRAKAQR